MLGREAGDAGKRRKGNREVIEDENGTEGLQEVEKEKDTKLAGGEEGGPVKCWDEEKEGRGDDGKEMKSDRVGQEENMQAEKGGSGGKGDNRRRRGETLGMADVQVIASLTFVMEREKRDEGVKTGQKHHKL